MQYTLFRLKIIRVESPGLYHRPDEATATVLDTAIRQRPSAVLNRANWHIGNVEPLDSSFVTFMLGKVTKQTEGYFDEMSGDFTVHSVTRGWCAKIGLDLESQACAIQHAPTLSKPEVLARNLGRILDKSPRAAQGLIQFEMLPLIDQEDFVQVIRRARRVTGFQMSISPPNPLDPEEHFERPMQRLLQEAGASSGHAAIYGPHLREQPVIDLTRAAARGGHRAKAQVQLPREDKPRWRQTDEGPMRIDARHDGELREKMQAAYLRIGGPADDEEKTE